MITKVIRRFRRMAPATMMKVAAVVIIAMLVSLNLIAWRAVEGRQTADAERDATAEQSQTLAEQVKAACAEGGKTAKDLGVACPNASRIAASPTVSVRQGEQGEAGRRGPPPTIEQVEAAVAVYCAQRGQCRGAKGDTPSSADVAAAVRAYCDARGDCRGPEGEQGDPPSDAQIASAVSSYCAANNDCRGPRGEQGIRGSQGPQGPRGERGPQGERGAQGERGPAGYPASFTFTHQGVTYRCTDDDNDRDYDCRPQQTPTPSPSP